MNKYITLFFYTYILLDIVGNDSILEVFFLVKPNTIIKDLITFINLYMHHCEVEGGLHEKLDLI